MDDARCAYAKDIASLTRGTADALLDAAEVSAGSRVLDVATGPGVVAPAAQKRGADVIAVDQAEGMVAIAPAAGVDARQAAVGAADISHAASPGTRRNRFGKKSRLLACIKVGALDRGWPRDA